MPDAELLPVSRAVEEWMDQAELGDVEQVVSHLEGTASWFKADWGTGSKSTVLDVFDRCVRRDFASGDTRVELEGVAANGRLGEFAVHPSPWEGESAATALLRVTAGPSLHLVAKITTERFALVVHSAGTGIQDLAGKEKAAALEAADAVRAERLDALPDVVGLKARRDIPGLLAALRHDDYGVSGTARRAIPALRDASAVKPLIDDLGDSDKSVRRTAALLLGELGDVAAVGPLIATVTADADSQVRGVAALALAKLGDSRAVASLVALMRANVSVASGEAARALGDLGDASAIEPLLEALQSDNFSVPNEAGRALGRLGDTRAKEGLEARFDAARSFPAALGLASFGHPEAVELLRETLRRSGSVDSDAEHAALALADAGDADSVELVIGALQRANHNNRREYIRALGMLGDPRAVEPLVALITAQDGFMASEAADALAQIGDANAVKPLIKALEHPGYMAFFGVIHALGAFGDKRAVKPLRACLARPDADLSIRFDVNEAIDRIESSDRR